MTSSYTSRHGNVSKSPEELYMLFCDMRNFSNMVPPQYKDNVEADYDNIKVNAQGITIAVRIDERCPYNLVRLISTQSPVEFVAAIHFDRQMTPGKTDFYIRLDVNLNLMMKTLLGNKIQQALDKLVESLEMASEGKMPDVPEQFKF